MDELNDIFEKMFGDVKRARAETPKSQAEAPSYVAAITLGETVLARIQVKMTEVGYTVARDRNRAELEDRELIHWACHVILTKRPTITGRTAITSSFGSTGVTFDRIGNVPVVRFSGFVFTAEELSRMVDLIAARVKNTLVCEHTVD